MSGTRAYDHLRDSWASAQSENMRLLVRELLRIFKWQQACPSEHRDHEAGPAGGECFSPKRNRFPACLLPEESLRSPRNRDESGGSPDTRELSSQICGLKAASGGYQEKFTPKGSLAISTSKTSESR